MQNLIQLRRMILARVDSRIDYTFSGRSDSLFYEYAGFIGDESTVAHKLRAIYQAEHAQAVKLKSIAIDKSRITPPVRGVLASLKEAQLPEPQRQRLARFIHRFPPVIIKLVPLHRLGFEDFAQYLTMHHMMIEQGSCNLRQYLDEARDERELTRRLRAFIACFCLGLIVPAEKKTEHSDSGKASVLQRIIHRVRGL